MFGRKRAVKRGGKKRPGNCPHCGGIFKLHDNGRLHRHQWEDRDGAGFRTDCPGSGQLPAQDPDHTV